MSEYIKREDVGLSDFEIVMCNGDYKEALKMLLEKVEKIPSADVVERKTGKWEWLSSTYDRSPCEMVFRCSKCHHKVVTHGQEPWELYCPNCGAYMREESEDD